MDLYYIIDTIYDFFINFNFLILIIFILLIALYIGLGFLLTSFHQLLYGRKSLLAWFPITNLYLLGELIISVPVGYALSGLFVLISLLNTFVADNLLINILTLLYGITLLGSVIYLIYKYFNIKKERKNSSTTTSNTLNMGYEQTVINEENKSIDTMNPLNFLENTKPKEESSISKPIEFTAIDESKYKMPDMVIKASEESALQNSNNENNGNLNTSSVVNSNENIVNNISNNAEPVQANFDITKTMIQPVMSTASHEEVSPQSTVNSNVNNMSNVETKTAINTNLTNINASINETTVNEVAVNNNQDLNTNINNNTSANINPQSETINLQEVNNQTNTDNNSQSNNVNNEFPSGSLLGDSSVDTKDLLDINKQI